MTHLPFIAASYAIFLLAACVMATHAAVRLRLATRRLAALDHRKATG